MLELIQHLNLLGLEGSGGGRNHLVVESSVGWKAVCMTWCEMSQVSLQACEWQRKQSKPNKFKCLRTTKLLDLIQSFSNLKCQISSNFPLFKCEIEVLQRPGTSMPDSDKFKFHPFSTTEFNLPEEQKL